MKPETKAKVKEAAAKASAEADTLTDKALVPLMASPYSWLILASSHLIAFAIGAFFF